MVERVDAKSIVWGRLMEDLKMPDVARVVSKYLATSGKNVAYIDYSKKIQDFLSWYRGKTAWHNYTVYNGENNIAVERLSLGMAKTVCEDLASLELNEKVEIQLDQENAQTYIDAVLEDNNWQEQANKLNELSKALGTGAFVAGIDDDKAKVDYIQGDMVFPLSWDNGIIKECAFVKIGGTQAGSEYTIILHELNENNTYTIKVVEVDGKGAIIRPYELGNAIDKAYNESGEQIVMDNIPLPLFQVFSPNIVNNYDKTNPLGMSVFGNAIDILKAIDVVFDSWHNEFVLGKKRIFVKSDLKKVIVNPGSGVQSQIDPNDVMFYQIDWTGNESDKPPIYESSMTLRATEHSETLDKLLNLLSRKVGLGDGFYAFNNGAVGRTATEVISVNSSLFRNIKKQELTLKRAIKGIIRALLYIGGVVGAGKFDLNQDITINFDDSIIEDTEKEQTRAMAEYNAGLIDRVEYFALTRSMSREQAIKFVAEMEATDTMKQVDAIMNNFGDI